MRLSSLSGNMPLCPQVKQVRECVEALSRLSRDRALTLNLIPAHNGYSSNEIVDGLAKKGAETPFYGPEPSMPISTAAVTTDINASTT
jgi:ribonuclease HI